MAFQDSTLNGTMSGINSTLNEYSTEQKIPRNLKLRKAMMDLLAAGKDTGFVKYLAARKGYSSAEADDTINEWNELTGRKNELSISQGDIDTKVKEKLGTGDLLKQYYTARNVISEMKEYRDLYSEVTKDNSILPTEISGENAARLKTKHKMLMFDIAQAQGTGALQEADKKLVEELLPDVTSMNPLDIAGQSMRGGISGNIAAFDDVIGTMKDRVSRYSGLPKEYFDEKNNDEKDLQDKTDSTQTQRMWKPEDDQKALDWAKENPDDPRSKQIYGFLGQQNEKEVIKMNPEEKEIVNQEEKKTDAIGTMGEVGKAMGGFLGGDEIGEAIGNKIGGWISKNGEAGKSFQDTLSKFAELKQNGVIDEKQYNSLVDNLEKTAKETFGYNGPSFRQIAGDALQAGLTIATTAVGGPLTKLGKVALGTATGYGFDVAGGLQNKEESVGEAFKPGLGTAIGTAIPLLGIIKNAFAKGGQVASERVMNSVVKPSIDDLEKSILYKGKTLGREMLDEGLVGTKRTLIKNASEKLAVNENKLQDILSDSTEIIKKEELLPYLSKLKEKLTNTPTQRAQKALQVVDDAIKLLPDEFDLSKANVLKRNLYDELRDLAYKLDPNLTPNAETSKAIASGLKDLIEKKSGNIEVSAINKKLGTYMKVQDGILDQLARTQRNNLMGVGTIGSMIEKTLGATVIKTYGATIIDKATKILEKTGAGAGGRLTKTIIMDAITKARKKSNRQ